MLIHLIALAVATLPSAALAHHLMDGATPGSIWQGFSSGVGHPVIGLDHLAFVAAMALLALRTAAPRLMPLAFVAMTVAGTGLHLAGISLPGSEAVIALSVVAVGVLAIAGMRLPVPAAALLFGVAGLFHGYAYGESIVGAEPSPLIAYLIGFAAMQTAIAWGIQIVADGSPRVADWMRVAGGIATGVGVMALAG
ncbi:MAG: HupE/UreJ family protein [Alphaproteobacteria bacterium]|nr:HupE/UreJ family protein [Alphaproteobacteria bacterium]MCB9931006.1 HupE/UreJ family protein [Alphaproteobacteria bacterium]